MKGFHMKSLMSLIIFAFFTLTYAKTDWVYSTLEKMEATEIKNLNRQVPEMLQGAIVGIAVINPDGAVDKSPGGEALGMLNQYTIELAGNVNAITYAYIAVVAGEKMILFGTPTLLVSITDADIKYRDLARFYLDVYFRSTGKRTRIIMK